MEGNVIGDFQRRQDIAVTHLDAVGAGVDDDVVGLRVDVTDNPIQIVVDVEWIVQATIENKGHFSNEILIENQIVASGVPAVAVRVEIVQRLAVAGYGVGVGRCRIDIVNIQQRFHHQQQRCVNCEGVRGQDLVYSVDTIRIGDISNATDLHAPAD